jgi:murein DD-endopeptidase MepM/ murein hydrolase activator NlpD
MSMNGILEKWLGGLERMSKNRLLSFLVALSATAWIVPATTAHADKLSDYQHQQSHLQQQTKSTKAKISQLANQETSLNNQISSIQTQVSKLQTSIAATEADIATRDARITALKQKIVQTNAEINDQYKTLEQRVRVMYEDGQTSYFAVLFSATSFSDLLDRIQLLSSIANQNKQILQGIETNKQKLNNANQTLQKQQVAEKTVYHTLESRKAAAESAEKTQVRLLAQVHDNRTREMAALQSENSALEGLKSLITQMVAEEGQYTGAASGWTWPVPSVHRVTSGYGWRSLSGSKEFHDGLDIGAPIGTPIVAATSGKVLYAGPASGFGDWIVIQSAGGLMEVYGHMYANEIRVSPGQIVSEGQQIAAVGNNGFSTGAHLHFTVATGFDSSGYLISVNPLRYI